MYKKLHLTLIFFFLILLANPSYAIGGMCGLGNSDNKCLKSKLIDLSLSPKIVNNADLLSGIKSQYNQRFVDKLTKKHPFLLKKPNANIDHKTLEWVEKIGFSKIDSPGVSYTLLPFIDDTTNYGQESFVISVIHDSYPIFKSRPYFFDFYQREAMKEIFSKNDFAEAVYILVKEYDLTEKAAYKFSKEIYKKIFKEKRYLLGVDIRKIGGHRLNIVGHGLPGKDYITDHLYIDADKLYYSEVVSILKKLHLPKDIDINLLSCFSGVGTPDIIIEKTTDELIDIFIDREVDTVIGDKENSYAYKFSKEIYETMPEFEGSIVGYKGEYLISPSETYTRSLIDPNQITFEKMHAIILFDINNLPVEFDRMEMKVKYKKSDFIK